MSQPPLYTWSLQNALPTSASGMSIPVQQPLHTSSACTSLRAPPPLLLEIPERMAPPRMPQLGFLSHDNSKEIFGLFGQFVYPNGFQNRWEYYYEPVRGNGGRILLCTAPDRELWTGDGVVLPGEPGVWRVTLYEPRYRRNNPA